MLKKTRSTVEHNVFYTLISLPSTAMGFALCIQISALSWILNTKYHLDIHEVGLVWAAGPLAGIFGQVIVGMISDKVWFWGGRRRPFILLGGTLAALMLLALPHIDTIASVLHVGSLLPVAVAVALTLDLAINVSFNPTRSIIADVTPAGAARTKGFTTMQTISGFFGVSAYLVGASFGNYALIYLGVGLVALFSIVPVFFIEEPRELVAEETVAEVADAVVVADGGTDWNQCMRLFVAHAFSWIGIQTMFVYIIAFIQQKLIPGGATQAEIAARSGQIIALAFAVLNTVGFVLPMLVLDPIARRIGQVRTHLVAVAVMAAGYFGIAIFAHSAVMLYVLMAVCGVGWAAVVSLPFAILSEKVEKGRMGFFMGIFNLSVVLPQLLVSLVLGSYIKDAADKSMIFVVCGVSLAVSAVLWMAVSESRGQQSKWVPSGGH
jgi:MFS family permease